MDFDWNEEKNRRLKEDRDISFEDVAIAINEGGDLEVVEHPNRKKYPKQFIVFVNIGDYVYAVPFVVTDKDTIFLKTIYPSRKATKKYLIDKK